MKILITGATGFVGCAVLKELLRKYDSDDIIALSSTNIKGIKTINHKNYNFDENYLIQNDCSDVEILIHIGAYTPKNSAQANDVLKNDSNIINTQHLLYSKLPNLNQIIFTSTLDVYANSDILTENSQVAPISLYGWSKLYCEKMIECFAKEKGIKYEILRLGHVFGEGEEKYQKILPLTIKKVLNNEEIQIWGDGEAIRTFIYIDDVAKAIVNSINLEDSEIINIVGEEQITINNLVKKIIEISRKDITVKHIESNVPNRNLIFDNTKLKDKLLSVLTPLNDGLCKEYQYMEKINQ